jgi:hypothetical protein
MIRLIEDHAGVVWVAFSSGVGLAVVDRPAGSSPIGARRYPAVRTMPPARWMPAL